jgi:hypothetical protein
MKFLKKFTVVDLFKKIDQLNKEKDKTIEFINEYSNNAVVVEYYIRKKDKLQTKIEFLLELIDELNITSKELGD